MLLKFFFKILLAYKVGLLLSIDFLWFLVWENFYLRRTVYISSLVFYAGVDPLDDFE